MELQLEESDYCCRVPEHDPTIVAGLCDDSINEFPYVGTRSVLHPIN
jgi:hypothetical protein